MKFYHSQTIRTLAIIAAAVMLTGCAARRFVHNGDAYRAVGRASLARREYEKALTANPELSDHTDFCLNYSWAVSRSEFEKGSSAVERRRWLLAVEHFQQSMQHDPGFEAASDALRSSKKRGAEHMYHEALELADQGNRGSATDRLEKALTLDPECVPAQTALLTVQSPETARAGDAGKLYQKACDQAQDKHWGDAAEALRRAIALELGHIPARCLLDEAGSTLEYAENILAKARNAQKRRDLEAASGFFSNVLDRWPSCPEAGEEFAEVDRLRRVAESCLSKAEQFFEKERWDEALASAGEAKGINVTRPGVDELTAKIRARAAAAYLSHGNESLAEGCLSEAEENFRRCFRYLSGMLQAREALAEVDIRRGDAMREREYWGNAFLWYSRADEHMKGLSSQQLNEMEYRIAQSTAARVAVAAIPGQDSPSQIPHEFEKLVRRKFLKLASPFLNIAKTEDGADYLADIEIRHIAVESDLVSRESLVHSYTVSRMVPNPELDRLEFLIREARDDLDRAIRREWMAFRYSDRSYGHRHSPDRFHHRKYPGWSPHSRFYWRPYYMHSHDVRRSERTLEHLQRVYSETPATIESRVEKHWPYTLEKHKQTGVLGLRLKVVETNSGHTVFSHLLEDRTEEFDSTVIGANPEVGLPADPLRFPSEKKTRSALLHKGMDRCAGLVAKEILTDIASAWGERRRELEAGGNLLEANEAGMRQMLVTRSLDAAASARLLEDLRTEYTSLD